MGIGAIIVLALSFILAVYVGNKVSNPILELKASAQIISQGDYSQEVKVESNDEIGILGDNFEEMRKQVKEVPKTFKNWSMKKPKKFRYLKLH